MWQHLHLSEQIGQWDTLAYCWGIQQPSTTTNCWHVKYQIPPTWHGFVWGFFFFIFLHLSDECADWISLFIITDMTWPRKAGFNLSPSCSHSGHLYHLATEAACCTDFEDTIFINFMCEVGESQFVCLFVCCLTSQQQASVSQGRICTGNFTCCHTEIEVADQLSTSPSHSILTPGWPVPVLTL